jgi:glycosyltransferase A (GT-A) superfamily protein (DUF2064 family)
LAKGLSKRSSIAATEQLILHTQRQAKDSALPVLQCFSLQQAGQSFGERLVNAIAAGFAHGYEKLIVCGTDSPHINSRQFADVAKKLDVQQLVLGPSKDGGVYLIGLHKTAFDKEAFLQIPWLTQHVFQSLKVYARLHHFSFCAEAEEADIDDSPALMQWQAFYSTTWFAHFIKALSLFCSPRYSLQRVITFHSIHLSQTMGQRGPPCL